MDVLVTFLSLIESYVTDFYPFFVIHLFLLAWFWWVLSRELRGLRNESEVLHKLEQSQAEQIDKILAEHEQTSRVARTLQAVLSTARTMSTVDVNAKTAVVSEPLRQGVATGTTIANLFLISGVLGTLVGMYQGAKAATAGDSPLASTLSGAFHAFGVTVIAIICAGFVLLVANRLRQRAVKFHEALSFQAERLLFLHKSELGGELARQVSQTMNEMKDLFKTQSKRFEDAEDVFRKALESLAALLAHFGGFEEVTAQMAKSVEDLRKAITTASSKMSAAMEQSVNAQREALQTGTAALQESWKRGLDAQDAILRGFAGAIEMTLSKAASQQQAAVDEASRVMAEATSKAARALVDATSSSANMLANAEKAAEEMVRRSAVSYESMLEQVLASVMSVKTQVENLDASFGEVARRAGDDFKAALGNIEYQMRQLVEQANEQTAKLESAWNRLMDSLLANIEHVIQTETRAFIEAVSKETTVMTKHFSDSLRTLENQITTATALVENVARRLDAVQRDMMATRPAGLPIEPSSLLASRIQAVPPRMASDLTQRNETGPRPVSPVAPVGQPASMRASPDLQREPERPRAVANPRERQPNAPTQVYDAAPAAVRSNPPLPRREEGPAGIPDVRSAPPSGKQDAITPVPVVPEPAAPQFEGTPGPERRQIPTSQQPPAPPSFKKDLSGSEREGTLLDASNFQGGTQEDTKTGLLKRLSRFFRRKEK